MFIQHPLAFGALYVELALRPPVWLHLTLWMPLTLIVSWGPFRPFKGDRKSVV